jgi:hypothetical protein
VRLQFRGEIFYWRGPSPFHFVRVPREESEELRALSSLVSYGWGVIPVRAQIGRSSWSTSLIPKDGGYLVPIKASIRDAEGLSDDDEVALALTVGEPAERTVR